MPAIEDGPHGGCRAGVLTTIRSNWVDVKPMAPYFRFSYESGLIPKPYGTSAISQERTFR